MKLLIAFLIILVPFTSSQSLPDLTISTAQVSQLNYFKSNNQLFALIPVNITLTNNGNQSSGGSSILIQATTVPTPANFFMALPGINSNQSLQINAIFLSQGNQRVFINITADIFNQVIETNENNNLYQLKTRT